MAAKSLEEKVQELTALVEAMQSTITPEEKPLVEIVSIASEPKRSDNESARNAQTASPLEKHRIHVILDEKSKARMAYLVEQTEASGNSALVRKALRALELIVLAEAEGAQVCFIHQDGSRSIIKSF